jgi:hydroxyethylthiazole kinase-like sugar kinase family protein
MALMSVAGEIAAEKAQAQQAGVGTMASLLLDQLQLLDEATFLKRIKLSTQTL